MDMAAYTYLIGRIDRLEGVIATLAEGQRRLLERSSEEPSPKKIFSQLKLGVPKWILTSLATWGLGVCLSSYLSHGGSPLHAAEMFVKLLLSSL